MSSPQLALCALILASATAHGQDGERIAFTSARGGFRDEAPLHPFNPQPYGDIYVMRADGSDPRALTENQFDDGTPTWIPTGRDVRSPHTAQHSDVA